MKYRVDRSTIIHKDLEHILPLIEDFTKWHLWSPWTIIEPDCKLNFTGKPGEPGHSMSWEGDIIGSGTNTLLEKRDKQLNYDLKFIKPFKSRAKVSFIFEPKEGSTKVRWTMDSSMPFFLFFMIKTMKNWIGMDYDRGLSMLKEIAEKGAFRAKTKVSGSCDLGGYGYVGIKKTVPFSQLGQEMEKDFARLQSEIADKLAQQPKHFLSLYPKMDMKNMRMTYIAAVSDEGAQKMELGREYVRGSIKKGKAFEVKHDGPYDFIGNAWSMGMMHLRAKKMRPSGVPFEEYWNDPRQTEPKDLKTSIFFPLK